MLVLKERILNIPVMSLQTGAELARTQTSIIDPRELKIVAFYCQGPTLDVNPAILTIDDIREVSDLGFIVDDADTLMSPDDLVRLKTIISYNFTLEGKQVVEENGRKVGKVANYTVDTKSFFIMQLHVQPGFMQAWGTVEVIISRTQIIEVTDTAVIVRGAVVHDAAPAKKLEHLVTNPFKRRRVPPEVPRPASPSSTTHPEARS
ncbi:MAG TPA: PRC-barrel domain-containing protein [Candidatus Saccharimonadales bacterium]|nr:PRC-barrel domain-containing protein [Candidatus Saccharimonadales bacterium]